jgi:hypothetical protein
LLEWTQKIDGFTHQVLFSLELLEEILGNEILGGGILEFDEMACLPTSVVDFKEPSFYLSSFAPFAKFLRDVPKEEAVLNLNGSGLKHGNSLAGKGFEDYRGIGPIADALVDAVVVDANSVLIEEAAEAVSNFDDF